MLSFRPAGSAVGFGVGDAVGVALGCAVAPAGVADAVGISGVAVVCVFRPESSVSGAVDQML